MSVQLQHNVSFLLYLWLSRTTGHVHVTGADSVVLPMANGALVGCEDIRALISRLDSHRVSLVSGPVVGEGSRRRMGMFLTLLSRRHGVDFTRAYDWEGMAGPPLECAWDLSRELRGLGQLPLPQVMQGAAERDADQERLLQRGIAAIRAGDWAAADAALSRARDLRMDDPLTLASLAWARLNNPRLPREQRVRDAHSYVQFAGQLAPEDPEIRELVSAVMKVAPALLVAACAA